MTPYFICKQTIKNEKRVFTFQTFYGIIYT